MISNLSRLELASSVGRFYSRMSRTPWWVEIKTTIPLCIYYFGPFHCKKAARLSQHGYIEDLVQEKAHGITVEIKRMQPEALTVCED